MARKAKNLGNYENLSPQVVELAYDINEEYNLVQALAKAKSRVVEQGASDRDQLSSDLHALKESGVSGDELLKNYNKAIHNNSDAKRVQHFEEMLLLGARLVPREFVRVNGEVMTVATPDDDTEEFAPTPLLLELEAYNRGLIYEFTWAIPVVGQEEMVQVNARTTVGKEAIKKELDSIYRGDSSQLDLLRTAEAYKMIEEPEGAEKLKTLAIDKALYKLRDVGAYTDSSDNDIANSFEVLDKTGTLDQFLEEISLEIAQDNVDSVNINASRYSFLHNLLAYRKVKRGECDSVWRARVDFDEITGLWLVLKAHGKALLALQRDQNGQ